jgi:hypothetical protein
VVRCSVESRDWLCILRCNVERRDGYYYVLLLT